MKLQKTFFALSSGFVFALLFIVSCEPAEKPKEVTIKPPPEKQVTKAVMPEAAKLALKFEEGDSAFYMVTLERDKSLEFAGEVAKDQDFKSGHTGSNAEVIFERQVKSVDMHGNAVLKVTIHAVKYLMKVKNQVVVDFDSSRPADSNSVLNQLIGKNYEVTITTKGEVVNIKDAVWIEAAVRGESAAQKAAAQLVSDEIVKKCHEVPALIDANDKIYKPGDKWKGHRTFSFDLMGSDSYEKIYTLKEIKDENGKAVALVDMIAVPVAEGAESQAGLSKMFAQTSDYTGEMKFDLTNGKVERYSEQMRSEWTVVDPESAQKGGEPSTIKMGTTELFIFKKID